MLSHPDKITRLTEHGLSTPPLSPMDPPHAFHLSCIEKIRSADLAEPLRLLKNDHDEFLAVLDAFEVALTRFRNGGFVFDAAISEGFRRFFHFMDNEALSHNAREEKALFPLLRKKLIASGECSPGDRPITSVDVMEDDHRKVGQIACLVFNLLGVGNRLKDAESRHTVFRIGADQGREIVETMRLHIFKENEVLFPQAQKMFTANEMEYVGKMMEMP